MAAKKWLIVGTIPEINLKVTESALDLEDDEIKCLSNPELKIRINRGLGALLGAALYTAKSLSPKIDLHTLLVGDLGSGTGSKKLYAEFLARLPHLQPLAGVTFHYLYPDVDWHNRLLMALDSLDPLPLKVADAGFMYAAKMSGFADHYDLFTPDHGELAFLADTKAPHPFYTRGFFLETNREVNELVKLAYSENNAAKWLIVKGQTDEIYYQSELKAKISNPNIAAMEAIGGTGDLVTGVVTGLLSQGLNLEEASILAAKASRLAGFLAKPTPATQIEEILPFLREALKELGV